MNSCKLLMKWMKKVCIMQQNALEVEMEVMYKIVPKYVFRDVEDEGVVLLPETDTLFALSESAKLVWKAMISNNNSITYSEMLHLLVKEYDAEVSVIKQDVDSFIAKMIDNKLFEVVKI